MDESICLGGMAAIRAWREARGRVSRANQMSVDDPDYRPLLLRLIRGEEAGLDLRGLPAEAGCQSLPTRVRASGLESLSGLDGRLELLVSASSGRRYLHGATCSVFGSPLPPGSLRELEPGVLLPSPELLVLQMAQRLGQTELLLLICELCGFYALAPQSAAGFLAAPAVMSVEGLARYTSQMTSLCAERGRRVPRGMAKVRKACSLAVGRAASPAETVCALLLCLQRRDGGYGLPRPFLNWMAIASGMTYSCDLLWEAEKVVLEYQGSCHESASAVSADRKKAVALMAEGYKVVQAGREDIKSLPRLDAMAKTLSSCLGTTWRSPSESFRARQTELRSVLLAGW